MKDIFGTLTERRILEAIARGDFKNLPGTGRPVKIESLYFLPRKLRAAYIVLKNSGYLDQNTSDNTCRSNPSPDVDLNPPNDFATISKQELSENILKYNVMMDCKRRH
ncbi:DnaJ family domain-containing protein [Desulfosporosinus fructosivorans]